MFSRGKYPPAVRAPTAKPSPAGLTGSPKWAPRATEPGAVNQGSGAPGGAGSRHGRRVAALSKSRQRRGGLNNSAKKAGIGRERNFLDFTRIRGLASSAGLVSSAGFESSALPVSSAAPASC
jgi:hypothetical protein